MKRISLKKLILLGILSLIVLGLILFLSGKFNKKNAASIIATVTLIITILDNIEIVLSFIERLIGIEIQPARIRKKEGERVKKRQKLLIVGPRPLDLKGIYPPFEAERVVTMLERIKAPVDVVVVNLQNFSNFRKKLRRGFDMVYYDGFVSENGLIFEEENFLRQEIGVEEVSASLKIGKVNLLIMGIHNEGFKDVVDSLYYNTKINIIAFHGKVPDMYAFLDRLLEEIFAGSTIGEAIKNAKNSVVRISSKSTEIIDIYFKVKKTYKVAPRIVDTDKINIETINWFYAPNPLQTPYFVGEFTSNNKKPGRLDMIYTLTRWMLNKRMKKKIALIVGDGGFGKTALAYITAKKLSNFFNGGVLWFSGKGKKNIPLYSFLDETFGLLLGENLLKSGIELKKQLVINFLRESSRKIRNLLIVADNIDYADETVWDFLLNLPEGTAAILTTRGVPRNYPLSTILHIGELTPVETRHMLRLLLEDSNLSMDELSEISSYTGGVPAVIEFVARDIKMKGFHRTLNDLKEHPSKKLSTRFDFSYLSLQGDFKKILWTLSVIPGSFSANCLKRLIGDSKLRDSEIYIENWHDIWTQLEESGQWIRPSAEISGRFEMHPVVRDYLMHKSDNLFLDEVERRFIKLMLTIARYLVARLNSANASAYVKMVSVERDNLLAAQDFAFKKSMYNEVIKFAYDLNTLFRRSGHWSDRWSVLKIGLKSSKVLKNDYHQAKILNQLGILAKSQGMNKDAKLYLESSLSIFNKINKEKEATKVLTNLGNLYLNMGNYKKAEELYIQAYQFYEERSMKPEVASSLANLGVLFYHKNKVNRSLEYFLKALEIYRDLGIHQKSKYREDMASVLSNLGVLYSYKGKYDMAFEYLQKALDERKKMGDKKGLGYAYLNIGYFYSNQGDYDAAKKYYEDALKIFMEINSKREIGIIYNNLGMDYLAQGDYQNSEIYLHKALEIRDEIKDLVGYVSTLAELGNLAKDQGNLDKALELYKETLEILLNLGMKRKLVEVLSEVADLFLRRESFYETFKVLVIVMNILRDAGDPKFEEVKKKIEEIGERLDLDERKMQIEEEEIYKKYLNNPQYFISAMFKV